MGIFARKSSARGTVLAVFAVLALAGCRVEVYDGLSQRDANEMTALLITAGIDAKRQSVPKDDTFAVTVDEDDFARAVQIISRSGLPKQQFATIVDVLSDDRLIASPSEERARLNYALSQELSRTVSEIDGIVTARVHLATPDDSQPGRPKGLSSAAVAIHHDANFNTSGFVPRIKMLVANAVDGLGYEKVSIALFPTSNKTIDWTATGGAPGFEEPASGLKVETPSNRFATPILATFDGRITPVMAAILGGGLLVLVLAGHSILTGRRRARASGESDGRRK